MDYLNRLNAEQLDAVRTTEGPVRVIAGAGTGKTGALTARYCYLADLMGIDTDSMLCVTFTNKAAMEMKQRIRRALGDVDLQYVCTFHSWCARMLREDIHFLGYPENFTLLDEDDRRSVLQKVYNDLGITLRDLPISRAIEYIGMQKGLDGYVANITTLSNRLPEANTNLAAADRLPEIYYRYVYEQKKAYALDYDDLIIFAHHILTTSPSICAKWQERMQYVMVDEFQDVSSRQYEIATILSARHHNLFIVGDPDQTIYTWRGAKVEYILDFDKLFPDAVTIVLADNYRSTPQILAPANALIRHNTARYPKDLRPQCPAGTKPLMYHARNEKAEARWVAGAIRRLINDGTAASNIAILYRANHLSRAVEDALLKEEIKYKIYSGVAFYARREIKDVLAYLRMLIRPDDISFLRTVNTPSRKIGRKTLELIQANAEGHGISLYDSLLELLGTPELARTQARQYVSTIENGRTLICRMALGDLVQHILDDSGYEQMLRGLSEWERLDNLAELKRAIEEAGHDDEATLDSFLQRAALISNPDDKDGDEDAIRMMTVHTAKGMEFDTVFLIGMNEGVFPTKRSSKPDDIEEERRLAYVAVTRARRRLFISDSEGFAHDRSAKTPSRFIYELGLDNLDIPRALPAMPAIAPPMAGATEKGAFAVGDRVEHPVFGVGTISVVDGIRQKYTVMFDSLSSSRSLRFGAPLDPLK
ncbi:MAG: UvrD-helicase domain-containing protein [Muribaculaceae bacterium]|nr:UvrD-helicase domain-containing protein [Muribaculaceae bacterium]